MQERSAEREGGEFGGRGRRGRPRRGRGREGREGQPPREVEGGRGRGYVLMLIS